MYKKTRKCQENTKNINQIHFYASADNMYKKKKSHKQIVKSLKFIFELPKQRFKCNM